MDYYMCPRCNTETNANKTITPCKSCQLVFCSSNCMINHYFDIHKHNSPSITEGSIITNPSFDKQFSLENLEKVYLNKRLAIIGSGTFCKVILYKSKLNNHFYAVKHMSKQTILDTCGSLGIIQKEIQYHSKLNHPNIIRLFNVQETEKAFDIVLEYANGGSLFDLIQKTQGLNEDQASQYFIQACTAVHFLHKHNLIHRDIKPENLLLDDKGSVKLCDFGWCSEVKTEGRSTFCGTIEYMAPEIVKEVPYDKSIDIWALGVLLYEMLHGYSPFKARNTPGEGNTHTEGDDDPNLEVFKNILEGKLVFNKNISNECKQLILKMIEPEKAKRLTIEDVFNTPYVKRYNKPNTNSNEVISKKKTHMVKSIQEKDYSHLFQFSNSNTNSNNQTVMTQSNKSSNIQQYINNNNKDNDINSYSILDHIGKKIKSKAKKNPIKYTKPIANITSSSNNRFLNMTIESPNKSIIRLDDDNDNVNNQIYFNKSSYEKTRLSKTNTSQNRNNKEEYKLLNMTTRYETSRDSLLDAFNLIDMTTTMTMERTQPLKQSKRLTFWQSFVNSFKCE